MFSFTSLMINSTVTTNERQIAEHFNKCFTSIAGKFNWKIVKTKTTHFSFKGEAKNDLLFLTPVTAEEIRDNLATIKSNKGNDLNGIPNNILKPNKKELSITSANFLILSFFKRIFQDLVKMSFPLTKKMINNNVINIDLYHLNQT